MSQETQIGNLSGGISAEDSKLVDSILNDINNSGQQRPPQQQGAPQQGPPQQQGGQQQQGQPSPDQIKMMQMARQQQMAQQQQMAAKQQQLQQQQQMAQGPQGAQRVIQGGGTDSLIESVKLEAKNIMTVILLCVVFNVEQVDGLFKTQSMFVTEAGALNMQAVFVKAILIGLIFYAVKVYLL